MKKNRFIISFCLVFYGFFGFSQSYTATESLFTFFNSSTFCPSLTALDDSSEVSLIFFKKNYLKEFTYNDAYAPGFTGIKGLYESPLIQNKMASGLHLNYEKSVIRLLDGIPIEHEEDLYSANIVLRYTLKKHFFLGAKVGYNYIRQKFTNHINPFLQPEIIYGFRSCYSGSLGLGFMIERTKTGITHNVIFESNKVNQFIAFYIEPEFRIKNLTVTPYLLSFTEYISEVSDISMLLMPRVIGVQFSHNRLFFNLSTYFTATSLTFGYGFLKNRLKISLSYIFFNYVEGIDNVFDKQNQNFSNIFKYKF